MLPVFDEHVESFCQVGRSQVSAPDFCGRHTSFYVCRDFEHFIRVLSLMVLILRIRWL